MATQLLCLRIYLAFAAEGLAKRYLVYYHAIRAYGTVAENGALPADEDTLAQIVEQLGAGAHASVPLPSRTRARGLHAPHRTAPPRCAALCWQQVSTSSTSSPRSRRTATPSTFET